jgi:phage tail-like protein
MAGKVQDAMWPLPKFHFEVKIGDGEGYFSEVSGLNTEVEVLEYRHGKSKQFSPFKMPGMSKVGDVTLKKGTFTKDIRIFNWFNAIHLNTIERLTVQISLLNEKSEVEITWVLENAFPIKVESSDLDAKGNDIAYESITLAHENLTIKLP